MEFWHNLSPAVRTSVIAGVVLLGVLIGARFYVSTPTGNFTNERGIAGSP